MGNATRPLRGSRLSSFYPQVPVEGPSISDLDSAFQLQEYISLLIRQNPHDVDTIVTNPGRVETSGRGDDKAEFSPEKESRSEIIVNESCWIYEQLRRLAQDLTHPLITSLQLECTRASCPEMKAGEWLYLCVAHGNDGAMEQCCAIDYIIHTLDSATALLNSPRAFPSRISIPNPSIRHFSSLARRLGRIFAHAYFHHREAFEDSEAENALYARFLALTARFDLVPPEFLVIPPRMVNPDASTSGADAEPPRLLGAALNPPPQSHSPEKPSPAILESPRKLGRHRTDTMVFSDADAEAFSEAFRGQSGSPGSSSSTSDQDKGSLQFNTSEDRDGGSDREGLPHVGSLELLAESSENRAPSHSETETEEIKPYTLTFSASGTMKTALPPGVSPSNSSTSGVALTPSNNANANFVNEVLQSQDGQALEGQEQIMNVEPEAEQDQVEPNMSEDRDDGPQLADLLARKQVLEGKEMQDLGLDEDDLAELTSGGDEGSEFTEVNVEDDSGEKSVFVFIEDEPLEELNPPEQHNEEIINKPAAQLEPEPVAEDADATGAEEDDKTTETPSITVTAEEISETDKPEEANPEAPEESATELDAASSTEEKETETEAGEKTLEELSTLSPDEETKIDDTHEEDTAAEKADEPEIDPNASLETDIADVENVLNE